jgi:hypothetical protein
MNKLIATSLVFIITLFSDRAFSQIIRQWKVVSEGVAGNYILDINSLKGEGRIRNFWMIIENNREDSPYYGKRMTGKWTVDCSKNTIGIIHYIEYNNIGSVINMKGSPESDLPIINASIIPDTSTEAVFNYVCSLRTN